MRLIDADELKAKVEAMVEHRVNENDYEFGRNQAFDYVTDILIDEAPTIEAVQGWIPCSERLPDVDVDVLTTTDWSEVLIAWLKKGGAWETDEYILGSDEILAWMPLPKPYNGGDDE